MALFEWNEFEQANKKAAEVSKGKTGPNQQSEGNVEAGTRRDTAGHQCTGQQGQEESWIQHCGKEPVGTN